MARLTGDCSKTLLALVAFVQAGCTATHRYYPDDDAGDLGGSPSTGGGSSLGGKSSTESASSLGGSQSAVGGSSSSGAGTIGQTAGGSSPSSSVVTLGGAVSTGTAGASNLGGNVPIGGTDIIATGGTTATFNSVSGGATAAGGISATGSASTTGGVSATGGMTAAGGLLSTNTAGTSGGAATGGASAAGGTHATGGATACSTNYQSDSLNCGSCGHSCLGGACVAGQCGSIDVTATGNSYGVALFGIDNQNLYYAQAQGGAVYASAPTSISKGATNGTGSPLVAGLFYANYYGPIGGTLFWTITPYQSSTTTAYSCDVSNCVEPTSGWKSGTGGAIRYHSLAPTHFATLEPPGTVTSIQWWDNYGIALNSYPVTNFGNSAMAAGDYVYWLEKKVDSQNAFVSASLNSVNYNTFGQAQLAGGMTKTTAILDVNEQSVLLYDSDSGDLLRVPLPLGLGNNTPTTLTNLGASGLPSATEDSNGVYVIDSQGTLSKCSASDCTNTTHILANAQVSASPIFQDSLALYWSHSSPNAIERLAK